METIFHRVIPRHDMAVTEGTGLGGEKYFGKKPFEVVGLLIIFIIFRAGLSMARDKRTNTDWKSIFICSNQQDNVFILVSEATQIERCENLQKRWISLFRWNLMTIFGQVD